MAKRDVAIVGAGIAGLTAAALLAPHARVTVYERGAEPGGKIAQVRWGNRSMDCGPTVFTLKPVFERIFAMCGERLEDHLSLSPLAVLARHAWPDGSTLDLYPEKERSADAIGRFAGAREAKAYLDYLNMAGRTWRTLYKPMIEQDGADFARMVAMTPPHQLVRLNPYISLWKELSLRFKDERLRQLFGRYTTYCGSSPFEAPGVMAMIAHVEQEGVWAVEGGIKSLADALANIAGARGASFVYGSEVEEIACSGGAVAAVRNGAVKPADIVLFNGDVAALSGVMSGMAGPHATPGERSLSAVTLCAEGTSEGFPLAMHNVFFSDDYRAEFDDVFTKGRIPAKPTVYVYAPDHDGAGGSPQRLMCLVNAPPDGDKKTYTEGEVEECKSRIHAQLKRCGLTLTLRPESIVTTTPTEFDRRFPQTGGALYGRPIHGWRASFQRPGIRTRTKGLYCAGGSVHPGSGVPMAALSGLTAARAIMKDYGLT